MPQLSFVADHDASDDVTYCVRLPVVVDTVRLAYYAAKLFKLLRGAPIPPPV